MLLAEHTAVGKRGRKQVWGSATHPLGSSPAEWAVALLFLSRSLRDAGREPAGLEGEQDQS